MVAMDDSQREALIQDCCQVPADPNRQAQALDIAAQDPSFKRDLIDQVTLHRLLLVRAGRHLSEGRLIAAIEAQHAGSRPSQILRLQNRVATDVVRRRRPWRVLLAIAALLLLSVGGALVIWSQPAPRTPAWTLSGLEVPPTVYSASEPLALNGPNGIGAVLDPFSQLRVEDDRLLLNSGRLRISSPALPSDRPQRFDLPDGHATIVGTSFTLERFGAQQRIAVTEGQVRGVFAGEQRLIKGGESWQWLPGDWDQEMAMRNAQNPNWRIKDQKAQNVQPIALESLRPRVVSDLPISWTNRGFRVHGQGYSEGSVVIHLPPHAALDLALTFDLTVYAMNEGASPYGLRFGRQIALPAGAPTPFEQTYPGELGKPIRYEILSRSTRTLANGQLLCEIANRIDGKVRWRSWSHGGPGHLRIRNAAGHDLEIRDLAFGPLIQD